MTPARWLAIAASVLAVVLALIYGLLDWWGVVEGPSKYDPSVAILTVTAIAVIWYTCFTFESIQQTRRQQRVAQRQNEDRLIHLSRLLRRYVGRLPSGAAVSDGLRNASLWRESDLKSLQQVASDLGEAPAQDAAEVVSDLRWLGDRCRAVKETDPRSGYSFRGFPREEWDERRDRASEKLRHLRLTAEGRRRVARMTGDEEILDAQGWRRVREGSE